MNSRVDLDGALPRRCPRSLGGEAVLTFIRRIAPADVLSKSLRKEVIQPQVPLRLPCYDLVPVTEFTFDTPESVRLRVPPASMT